MYEVTAEMIDDTCTQVRIISSNVMYIEDGEIWGMMQLDRFCEAEMIDLVIL
jgi:hypothetical protein